MAVVSQICFPSITGDDQPRPGMFAFQAMPLVSLHTVGSPFAEACPCPPGPRHSGHSAANADAEMMPARMSGAMRWVMRMG